MPSLADLEHAFESSIDDNRPFPSCILPQFENESPSETIYYINENEFDFPENGLASEHIFI